MGCRGPSQDGFRVMPFVGGFPRKGWLVWGSGALGSMWGWAESEGSRTWDRHSLRMPSAGMGTGCTGEWGPGTAQRHSLPKGSLGTPAPTLTSAPQEVPPVLSPSRTPLRPGVRCTGAGGRGAEGSPFPPVHPALSHTPFPEMQTRGAPVTGAPAHKTPSSLLTGGTGSARREWHSRLPGLPRPERNKGTMWERTAAPGPARRGWPGAPAEGTLSTRHVQMGRCPPPTCRGDTVSPCADGMLSTPPMQRGHCPPPMYSRDAVPVSPMQDGARASLRSACRRCGLGVQGTGLRTGQVPTATRRHSGAQTGRGSGWTEGGDREESGMGRGAGGGERGLHALEGSSCGTLGPRAGACFPPFAKLAAGRCGREGSAPLQGAKVPPCPTAQAAKTTHGLRSWQVSLMISQAMGRATQTDEPRVLGLQVPRPSGGGGPQLWPGANLQGRANASSLSPLLGLPWVPRREGTGTLFLSVRERAR